MMVESMQFVIVLCKFDDGPDWFEKMKVAVEDPWWYATMGMGVRCTGKSDRCR